MSELKPCPFCGETPDLFPKDPEIEGDAWASVKCINEVCDCKPELKIYEDACAEGESGGRWLVGKEIFEEATRRWNTRATPTGTIITEDESTWPEDAQLIMDQYPLIDGGWGHKKDVIWLTNTNMPRIAIGCIWWPIGGMFQPPTTGAIK